MPTGTHCNWVNAATSALDDLTDCTELSLPTSVLCGSYTAHPSPTVRIPTLQSLLGDQSIYVGCSYSYIWVGGWKFQICQVSVLSLKTKELRWKILLKGGTERGKEACAVQLRIRGHFLCESRVLQTVFLSYSRIVSACTQTLLPAEPSDQSKNVLKSS